MKKLYVGFAVAVILIQPAFAYAAETETKAELQSLYAQVAEAAAQLADLLATDDADSSTPPVSASPTGYTQEIADGVYSYSPDGGVHSMFMITDTEVAVFETYSSDHSTQMLAAIRELTDLPITYAFHTHNHWDHTSGGAVFTSVGAETVAHTLAAQYLEANPGPDTALPTLVWEGAQRDFTVGDLTVEAHYLGLNHGLGMTVYVIPERRAAYIADLVTPNRVMFTIVPDFNIGEWKRSLAEIQELDFDIAVCSHNEVPAEELPFGCTQDHVAEQLQFIEDLEGALMEAFASGAPNPIAAVSLPQYEDWAHYDDWLEMNVWRVMLDMMMGPYPWVPQAE